jgi:hypothetical protein
MLGAQRLNSKHVRESIALENVARKKADGERDVLLKRGASGIHKYNLQLAKDLANAESGDIKRREQLLRNAESGIHKFRLQIANDIAKAEQDAAGKRNELLRNAESGIYKFRLAMTAETEKQMLGAINSERKAYESYQQGAIRADREMHRERLSMIEDEFKARIRMQNELERRQFVSKVKYCAGGTITSLMATVLPTRKLSVTLIASPEIMSVEQKYQLANTK